VALSAREKISACITCCNEERNIRRCLKSVVWADEIVIVDSFSKDRTVEICREFTDKIYQHEWLGYIGQKNLIKEMAAGPWILFVDADEEVSPELRCEIVAEFQSGRNSACDGYEFPRMVRYLGRWIRHGEWYPDLKMRLFRKAKGICAGQEPHDRTTVDGTVKRLKGHLFHYTYDNLQDQIHTINDFSTITAHGMFRAHRRFRWRDLLFRPQIRFFKAFIVKRGFMDGMLGFIIAMCSSFGVLLKYAKLYELYRSQGNQHQTPNHNGDSASTGTRHNSTISGR
jgi:glycosyltransferase involved in cell wall biosynthesis